MSCSEPNIASRCRKMEEEFNEYKAAVKHALPEFDGPGRMNAVIDELADLNAVVFHSAVILGYRNGIYWKWHTTK